MSHNNFVSIRKRKVSLKLNKPAYIGMCVLELSKVLMYLFHYDCIKNKYSIKSKPQFTENDSLLYEIKTKMSMKILTAIKKCLILGNYWTKSKII